MRWAAQPPASSALSSNNSVCWPSPDLTEASRYALRAAPASFGLCSPLCIYPSVPHLPPVPAPPARRAAATAMWRCCCQDHCNVTWVRLFWSDRPGRWHKSRRRAVPRHAAGPAGPTDPTGPASPAAAAASSDMDVTSMSSWQHGCDIHVVTGPPARPGRTPPAPPAPAPGHSLWKSHTRATWARPIWSDRPSGCQASGR